MLLRSRNWRRRLVLATVFSLAALVVVELCLRWLMPLTTFCPPYRQNLANDFARAGMFQSLADDHLKFGLTPDHTAEVGGISYRHNGLGLRGPQPPSSKPAEVYRLLVVGDSYTYGWGVAERDTVPGQLERLLREDVPSGRILEVINAGIPAYDTAQEEHLV